VKATRIIIDGVKDHIIPHLSGKKTIKEMWESLTKLYQSDNQTRKMMLSEKLRSTKMVRGDIVASYLLKITQIQDELAAVGEVVDETKLVRIALNGFTVISLIPQIGICASTDDYVLPELIHFGILDTFSD
jgi:hypothetical protein